MGKKVKIIIAIIAVTVLILLAVLLIKGFEKENTSTTSTSNLNINSEEDLTTLIDQIYAGVSIEMPMLMTQPIDISDADMVQMFTGLDNAENIEYLVVSEPMMSSQAYSLVLVKAKDGANVDSMAKEMNENINERKWICVTAEKIYTTSSGNVICLVMTNEETAKTVFESFKTLAGSVGKIYERTAEQEQLPEDMLPGETVEAY